jgi:hypothetical protein
LKDDYRKTKVPHSSPWLKPRAFCGWFGKYAGLPAAPYLVKTMSGKANIEGGKNVTECKNIIIYVNITCT